jgi:hypothetical protein
MGSRYARPYTRDDALRIAAWAEVAKLRNAFLDAPACQMCGSQRTLRDRPLCGHHWRGYEYPTDIWWVCDSCHTRMRVNRIGHDGSVTLDDARAMLGYTGVGRS